MSALLRSPTAARP